VVIIVFSVLGLDFTRRYIRNSPARKEPGSRRGILTLRLKIMLAALGFSIITLFIRCAQ
jgi:hypothetical protein